MRSPRRPLFCAAIAALAATSLLAQDLPPGAGPPQKLFDGKTLDGWVHYGGKAPFSVKDGVIVGTYVEEKNNSFLATEKDYGDFVLDLDFKFVGGGGNSGVQFRSHTRPEGAITRVFGYQAEIDPGDPTKIGGIYEEGARGWINDLRKTDTGKKVATAFKRDDWNHYRIAAVGDHIRTWLNGVPISDYHDDKQKAGLIALQVHAAGKSSTPKEVLFKNVELRQVFPPKAP